MRHAYNLILSDSDIETIRFVGYRYGWSDALSGFSAGENPLTEAEAWEISEAFTSDAEGGHSMFPMLDPRSSLCEKLFKFYESIV